jgi:hypothetical protein
MRYVILALALLFAIPAHADSFDVSVTGQTDFNACASIDENCKPMTFSIDFQTVDAVIGLFGDVVNIESFSGTLNGQQISGGTNGWLYPAFNYIAFEGNDLDGIFGISELNGLRATVDDSIVSWNVTVTPSVPEPSTFFLLLFALPLLKLRSKVCRMSHALP